MRLYSKQSFFLKSHFSIVHSEKKLTLLLIPGLLLILTLIIIFTKRFLILLNILRFLCNFGVCSGIFWKDFN